MRPKPVSYYCASAFAKVASPNVRGFFALRISLKNDEKRNCDLPKTVTGHIQESWQTRSHSIPCRRVRRSRSLRKNLGQQLQPWKLEFEILQAEAVTFCSPKCKANFIEFHDQKIWKHQSHHYPILKSTSPNHVPSHVSKLDARLHCAKNVLCFPPHWPSCKSWLHAFNVCACDVGLYVCMVSPPVFLKIQLCSA